MVDGAASLTVDRRCWPVVLATWLGEPTLALIEKAQVWLDGAYAEARAWGLTGLVVISDVTRVEVPDVEVRRRATEFRHDQDLLLAVVALVCARNVMVRGVISGLAWVLGDARFAVAYSHEHALMLAKRAFERRGIAVPPDLDRLGLDPG